MALVSFGVLEASPADQDPDSDSASAISLTHFERYEIFIHSTCSLHCVMFLVSVIDVILFNILDCILKFSGKGYSLAFSFGLNRSGSSQMMTIRPDVDPQHLFILCLLCRMWRDAPPLRGSRTTSPCTSSAAAVPGIFRSGLLSHHISGLKGSV